MFYWLAQYFDFAGFLNLFRYLTFRSGAAVGTAFVIGLIIGPKTAAIPRNPRSPRMTRAVRDSFMRPPGSLDPAGRSANPR